jgi:cell wall-associated NlpC family hydrolase
MSESKVEKQLDRRLNAYRPDLADVRLAGQVQADRYVDGETFYVGVPVTRVHMAPDAASDMDTQFLHGEELRVFDRRNGWAWVQGQRDSYVGYVPESNIVEGSFSATHIACVPRTFVYPEPELKRPALHTHSMGALVNVVDEIEVRGTRYAILDDDRAMILRHLRPLDRKADDFVSVAEQFIHTPYLWGGASGMGIDCSGLVQLSMRMAGKFVQRDTDMQASSIGIQIDPDSTPLQRGDLVFWQGHVAIFTSPDEIIHANGYSMQVSREPLAEAIARIDPLYGLPTLYRRP